MKFSQLPIISQDSMPQPNNQVEEDQLEIT